MILKCESELKRRFTQALKRAEPSFSIHLFASAGSPDRLIAGNGKMSLWEFKHATPRFASNGLQVLTCQRLAHAGHCRYVIWQDIPMTKQQQTLIVHPNRIADETLIADAQCEGFDMQWLVEQIRKAHQ